MVFVKKLLCVLLTLALLSGRVCASGRVALSFDDGPSGANTEALLDMLGERDVRATFFLCGYRIEAYPDLCGQLARAGHELGVHGYSHGCFDAMDPGELREELSRTAALLRENAEVSPALVRPPCGALNGRVCDAAREAGMAVILWSVDPEDWRCRDPDAVVRRVCGQVHDGSVILLHDMYPSSVEAAGRIIDRLRAEGYEFLPVSELAARTDTPLVPGEVYRRFGTDEKPGRTRLPGEDQASSRKVMTPSSTLSMMARECRS